MDGMPTLEIESEQDYIPRIYPPPDQPSGLRRGFVFLGFVNA